MADKIFADGCYFKRNPKAPDYVVGQISIDSKKFRDFMDLNTNHDGWLNIDVTISKKTGNPYCSLNDYVKPTGEPTKKEKDIEAGVVDYGAGESQETESTEDTIEYPEEAINEADIPF